jgi:hypothetical protein
MAKIQFSLSIKGVVMPDGGAVEDLHVHLDAEYTVEESVALLAALPDYLKALKLVFAPPPITQSDLSPEEIETLRKKMMTGSLYGKFDEPGMACGGKREMSPEQVQVKKNKYGNYDPSAT